MKINYVYIKTIIKIRKIIRKARVKSLQFMEDNTELRNQIKLTVKLIDP